MLHRNFGCFGVFGVGFAFFGGRWEKRLIRDSLVWTAILYLFSI
jgi:hypothetical protein